MKPARQQDRSVEDAPVATATKARGRKAKPVPTDATPAVVDQPVAQPEQNATVAKSGAKKGKTKAGARQPLPHPRNQNASMNSRPLPRGWKAI